MDDLSFNFREEKKEILNSSQIKFPLFLVYEVSSIYIYIGNALTSVDKTVSWLSAYPMLCNFSILKDNRGKGGLDVE